MQKITLKQKPTHYGILEQLLAVAEVRAGSVREEKAAQSILQKVYLRVIEKAVKARIAPDGKPMSIDLKYYEADVLERTLRDNRGHYHAASYEYNVILTIVNELDQKLQ